MNLPDNSSGPPANKPLAADPYAHQPDGEWKTERQHSDRQMLSELFAITEDEVYEGSKQFLGREHQFFKFLFAMRFLSRAIRFELTENATILKVCSLVFAIEGITPGQASDRLSKFLVTCVDRAHKMTLLRGFTFTPEYQLGEDRKADRHLMFEAAIADNGFRTSSLHDQVPNFCSTGQFPSCFCLEWLNEQPDGTLNEFVSKLGGKLYQMRCAVVHDGTPVVFGDAGENKPTDVAHWSVSLVDAYSVKLGQFVTYESGILVPKLSAIMVQGLRRCFENGAKF
jgi:hypothetical protein